MTEHDTKTLQDSLAQRLDADLAALKSNSITTERPSTIPNGPASVAEQMFGVASTIKGIHRDLDALQADFVKQLDALRKRLGGRG
jgi:hypothetical protein